MSLFPLVFFFGGVCSGPVTEVTSEVRIPELFLSGFARLSWLVADLVFGKFFSNCFCGCNCFTHNSYVFWLLGYFFCRFYIFCSLYHPSCFWVGDILSMFYFGNLFFFLPYLTISRTSAMVSLAVSTLVVFLAVCHILCIFRILAIVYIGPGGSQTSDICSILKDLGYRFYIYFLVSNSNFFRNFVGVIIYVFVSIVSLVFLFICILQISMTFWSWFHLMYIRKIHGF